MGLYQEKFPSVLNQRVARIDVDENKAEKQFIYFTFANRPAVYSLASIANGSAQKNLTTEHVLNFPIALPPLPEQKSIAAVLSSLDDKIELLRAQNKTLEEMAQRLFKEWFVDFNFSNSDGKPYKASGGKMVKSEIGEIPEGWNMGQVRELVDVLSGFAFRSNTFMDGGLYKLVTIRNVQDGTFVSETRNQLESIPSNMPYYCKLQNGDVLLSLTGNVGRVCQVVGDDYLLNQRVAKLQPKQFEDSGFMFLLFRQPEMIGILEHLASGTAQQNLSPVKTGTMTILLPPRNFLDMFGEKINPMLDKVLKNKEQIQTLSKLRDTMLPKLMNGEIVVSNK
ncbi:TPA: restriction endonuclease subunit S [Candidatus Uhrbacteria bacterium]|nr:restriction endonuclease subunit S [Candidatus Uhrbacteria bacterium]